MLKMCSYGFLDKTSQSQVHKYPHAHHHITNHWSSSYRLQGKPLAIVLCVYWQAEVNAQKASNNAQRSVRQLEETITDFQRQKLEDIQVSPKQTHAHTCAVFTDVHQGVKRPTNLPPLLCLGRGFS